MELGAGGGQRTEVRGRRSEDGGQRAEVRGRRSEMVEAEAREKWK
jgi:hypothetical protein